MITKQSKVLYLDSIEMDSKTISIVKREYTLHNGMVVTHQDIRKAFVPGQIEKVKEFIGENESPEITYLESVWTPEVISDYEAAKLAATGHQS